MRGRSPKATARQRGARPVPPKSTRPRLSGSHSLAPTVARRCVVGYLLAGVRFPDLFLFACNWATRGHRTPPYPHPAPQGVVPPLPDAC
jgi:hypothetical protein